MGSTQPSILGTGALQATRIRQHSLVSLSGASHGAWGRSMGTGTGGGGGRRTEGWLPLTPKPVPEPPTHIPVAAVY